MSGPDIKGRVKKQYGQAALRVTSGGSSCGGAAAASALGCDRSQPTFMTHPKHSKSLKELYGRRWAAAIQPHWLSLIRAKLSSISAAAVASTFYCLRSESARGVKPTVST